MSIRLAWSVVWCSIACLSCINDEHLGDLPAQSEATTEGSADAGSTGASAGQTGQDPGTTGTTTGGPASSSTGGDEETGAQTPTPSCAQTLPCVDACLLEEASAADPDLGCVLECVEQDSLPVDEAARLLDLLNCSGDACALEGACVDAGDTEGTGTGADNACFACLWERVSDASIPGCEEQRTACA